MSRRRMNEERYTWQKNNWQSMIVNVLIEGLMGWLCGCKHEAQSLDP